MRCDCLISAGTFFPRFVWSIWLVTSVWESRSWERNSFGFGVYICSGRPGSGRSHDCKNIIRSILLAAHQAGDVMKGCIWDLDSALLKAFFGDVKSVAME